MPLSRLVGFLSSSRSLTRDKSKYGKHCGIEGPPPASHSGTSFAEQRPGTGHCPEDAGTNTFFSFTMNFGDDIQGEAVEDFALDRECPGSDDGGEVREDQNRIITIRNRRYLVTVVENLESSTSSAHDGTGLSFNVIPPPNEMIQIGHWIAPFFGPRQFLVRVIKVLGLAPSHRRNASPALLPPSIDEHCVVETNTGKQELVRIKAMYEYPQQPLATQPSIVIHSDGNNGHKVITFAHVPSYRYLAEFRRTLAYDDDEVTFDVDDISTQSPSSAVPDDPLADPVCSEFRTTRDDRRINDWIEETRLASGPLPPVPLPATSTSPADSHTSTQAVVGRYYLPEESPAERLWDSFVDHGLSTHAHSFQARDRFFSHNPLDLKGASCTLASTLPPLHLLPAGVMMDEDGAVSPDTDTGRTDEILRIFEECTYPEVVMRDVRRGLGLNDEPGAHECAERWEVNGRRVQGLIGGSNGFMRRQL